MSLQTSAGDESIAMLSRWAVHVSAMSNLYNHCKQCCWVCLVSVT